MCGELPAKLQPILKYLGFVDFMKDKCHYPTHPRAMPSLDSPIKGVFNRAKYPSRRRSFPHALLTFPDLSIEAVWP